MEWWNNLEPHQQSSEKILHIIEFQFQNLRELEDVTQEIITVFSMELSNVSSSIENLHELINKIITDRSQRDQEFSVSIDELNSRLSHEMQAVQNIFGQIQQSTDALESELEGLENSLTTSLFNHEVTTESRFREQSERTDSLDSSLAENKADFQEQVDLVSADVMEARSEVDSLARDVGATVRYLVYAIGAAAVAGLLGVALGFTLRRRIDRRAIDLEANMARIRKYMEEENVKLDSKLINLLQDQLRISEALQAKPEPIGISNEDLDHSLPLRVGEEIFRMRLRLQALPGETKGLKPLLKSLERLEDEFNAKGYELVDMLNMPYSDGLGVRARFIPGDDLQPDERIITKVIRPQINYHDIAVQTAEVEVSTGE